MTDKNEDYTYNKYIIFRILNEEFAVNIGEVKEITNVTKMNELPDGDAYIQGVVNLRDKVVIIYNLAKKLNIKKELSIEKSKLIILDYNDSKIGMLVDTVSDVMEIDADEIQSTTESINTAVKSDYIKGVAILKKDKRMIVMIDLIKIISKEMSKIKTFQ